MNRPQGARRGVKRPAGTPLSSGTPSPSPYTPDTPEISPQVRQVFAKTPKPIAIQVKDPIVKRLNFGESPEQERGSPARVAPKAKRPTTLALSKRPRPPLAVELAKKKQAQRTGPAYNLRPRPKKTPEDSPMDWSYQLH